MKIKNYRKTVYRVLIASILPVAMIAPVQAADTNPIVPIAMPAPAIPGVNAVPFGGVHSATFTTPITMANLDMSASQGFIGDSVTISGKGLAANTPLTLTWSTADGTWVTDIQPNSVNYLGTKFTKYNVDMATVTTDANGVFSYTTKIPADWGGVHDIYAVSNGVAVGHAGYQISRTMTISPSSGPIGTPITITYTGLGATLYTGGAAVHWDNSYAGEMMGMWTRGVGQAVIRAVGPVGLHTIDVKDAITFAYLNIQQSPVPFANGGSATFTVTADKGAPKPSVDYPVQVEPTVTQRTLLTTAGLDPNAQGVATLTPSSGPILTKTQLRVTGIPTTGVHQIVWASVVGNRVNCASTCWAYSSVPLGTANVTNGTINQAVTVPDNLGGWHVIQVKKGDVVEAQASFYVKTSIMPFYDKNGKQIGLGVAKADNSGSLDAVARGGAGAPSTTFKNGEEFTISIKGVGWTQLDNTMAVTYDNSHVGYGCGFNSNGYMVIHIRATGAPGTHLIDLYPQMYTSQPSFANTPYGLVPVLSYAKDFPGLALGYQIPAIHFAITVVK